MNVTIEVAGSSASVLVNRRAVLRIGDHDSGPKVDVTCCLPVDLREVRIQSAAIEAALRLFDLMEEMEQERKKEYVNDER